MQTFLCKRGIPIEPCGAMVKLRIQDREYASSTPASVKCCVLEQDTLSRLLKTGFYPERLARNTQKMRVRSTYRKKRKT